MRSLLLVLLLLFSTSSADDLKKQIAHMLVVGFDGTKASEDLLSFIREYELGGVILFDINLKDRSKPKNIVSKEQVFSLTTSLKNASTHPLLVCVDEEGGKVSRLKPKHGYDATPSPKRVAEMDDYMAKHVYNALASKLDGFNCNFTPVLDLSINPANPVIASRGRSYSDDPKVVAGFATIAIDALGERGIITAGKHFPGHGSSDADSHDGFVDVSSSWSEVELEPYKILISKGKLKAIMSAHIFNKSLDPTYPATLSYATNTELLRHKLGFDGVLFSDDMQMGAIAKNYSLAEAVTLAINSGIDLLIFGNQLGTNNPKDLVDLIYKQVRSGAIKESRIEEANARISKLLEGAR